MARLYLRMKMNRKTTTTQIAWVLLYVQGGVVETWKDNLLDELAKKESEIEIVETLFKKIWDEFEETSEEERKIEQLRMIEQVLWEPQKGKSFPHIWTFDLQYQII